MKRIRTSYIHDKKYLFNLSAASWIHTDLIESVFYPHDIFIYACVCSHARACVCVCIYYCLWKINDFSEIELPLCLSPLTTLPHSPTASVRILRRAPRGLYRFAENSSLGNRFQGQPEYTTTLQLFTSSVPPLTDFTPLRRHRRRLKHRHLHTATSLLLFLIYFACTLYNT